MTQVVIIEALFGETTAEIYESGKLKYGTQHATSNIWTKFLENLIAEYIDKGFKLSSQSSSILKNTISTTYTLIKKPKKITKEK